MEAAFKRSRLLLLRRTPIVRSIDLSVSLLSWREKMLLLPWITWMVLSLGRVLTVNYALPEKIKGGEQGRAAQPSNYNVVVSDLHKEHFGGCYVSSEVERHNKPEVEMKTSPKLLLNHGFDENVQQTDVGIPESIGDSLQLTLLDLSSNGLVRYIPSTIRKLTNLLDLTLNSNQLTGKIPAEIGDCISLENLSLFDNNFNGELPAELGRLTNLQSLRAGGNKDISGPIPEELGNAGI